MVQIDVITQIPDRPRLQARFLRPGPEIDPEIGPEMSRDMDRIQALRSRVFRAGQAPDGDAFDALCRHIIVENRDGALVCCLRVLDFASGAQADRSYAAQHYDLSRLQGFAQPIMEIGRFCIDPDHSDPAILRVAWAFIAEQVLSSDIGLLFGCSSFAGLDPGAYRDTFRLLKARHLGPARWMPGAKAAEVVRFGQATGTPDLVAAMRAMPPLLRSYLMMGGWVSDHAVMDHDLGTLHVFTALEIAAIPPARRRFLQAAGAARPVGA